MNSQEMLRIIDSIARDRNIEREVLIADLEQAMVTAARKHYHTLDPEEFVCTIDRLSGELALTRHGEPVDMPPEAFGRIAAQTFKQVMIQRFRDDERQSLLEEYSKRIGTIVTGVAQRYDRGALIVQIDRAEAVMLRSEQIPGEQFAAGDRVRCLVLDVKGDYTGMCAEQADRTLVVGTCQGATPINLIAGLPEERFRQVLFSPFHDLRAASGAGGYFLQMGVDAAFLAFLFVRYGLGREPTLADIAHYLTRPQAFCSDLHTFEAAAPRIHPLLLAQIEQEAGNVFGILGIGGYGGGGPSQDPRVAEQWAWATNFARSVLGPFAVDPVLRRQFCADEALDFGSLLYDDDGRVVVLDCPEARYGTVSATVSKILRLQYQDAVRRAPAERKARAGIGTDRFTFLFVDEFQAHVAAPGGSEVFNDADWFATSRSFGNINIVATQGLAMLLSRGNESAVRGIVQNCRTKIILGVEDEPSLELASTLSFGHEEAVRRHLVFSKGVGTGFVFLKHASAEQGRTVASKFDCSGETTAKFMRKYVGVDYPPVPQVTIAADDALVANPRCAKLAPHGAEREAGAKDPADTEASIEDERAALTGLSPDWTELIDAVEDGVAGDGVPSRAETSAADAT